MNSISSLRIALLGMLPLFMSAPGQAIELQTIVLASTTSVQDSGLLTHILPQFTAETSIEVHVLAQGTGQALATAAHGDADWCSCMTPRRKPHSWQRDMASAGPRSPGTISSSSDLTLTRHMSRAAPMPPTRSRRSPQREAPFVSRGDKSGTDAEEKRLWRAAGVTPSGGWYRDIGGGMGAALNAASAMGAYTHPFQGAGLVPSLA